jgi:hypothetical protein
MPLRGHGDLYAAKTATRTMRLDATYYIMKVKDREGRWHMKGIFILLLGVVIWSGSLLWPEVNHWLSPAVALAMLAGLAALWGLSAVVGRLNPHRQPECCDTPPCRNIPDCRTRPATTPLSSR